MRFCLGIALVFGTCGCASNLVVYDSAGRSLPGYPVATPVTYIETGEFTALAKGGKCQRVAYSREVTLPVGAPVFVNVKPAQFAKTGLVIKFQANGTAQEVSLNTEPSGGDVIKAATEVIKTVAPIVGLAAPGQAAGADGNEPPCDAVPDLSSIKRMPLQTQ